VNMPPIRYRMITPQFSISSVLSKESVHFLHDQGCRKIVTVSAGFASPEVVSAVKTKSMEVEHFPLDLFGDRMLREDQIKKVCSHVLNKLKSGSNIHLVGGHEMTGVACVTGIIRRFVSEWPLSSAVSEALDICRFVDSDFVLQTVENFDFTSLSYGSSY
jgi:hypothetical protein